MPANDIATRFVEVREHFGKVAGRKISQRELAEWLNVAKNSWRRYEAGELPGSAILIRLAAEGVNTHWLLTGQGEMFLEPSDHALAKHAWLVTEVADMTNKHGDPHAMSRSGYILIPRYDVAAAAGNGATVDDREEAVVDHVAFKREWLHRVLGVNPADLVIISARGESGQPRLRDGDLLLLDRSEPKVRSGRATYVFRYEGLLYVKQLEKRLDGGLLVTSENADLFPPEIISADRVAEVNIIGRLVWSAGRV